MVLRPSSDGKLIQSTTQQKQTNPQPNPNTTLLRIIIVNIYIWQHKSPLGGSRSRGIGFLKPLLSSYPGHFIFMFLLIIGISKIYVLFFLSRSHTFLTHIYFTGKKHALPKMP